MMVVINHIEMRCMRRGKWETKRNTTARRTRKQTSQGSTGLLKRKGQFRVRKKKFTSSLMFVLFVGKGVCVY